jgi:hypothetical protein
VNRGEAASTAAAAVLGASLLMAAGLPEAAPVRGLTHAAGVARVYDRILDADFDTLPPRLAETCPPAPAEACLMLDAVARQWRVLIDPADPSLLPPFTLAAERAITESQAWTTREPERAEAWFYLGGAYAARAQLRVLRKEPLAAARDGKRIKEALERGLRLDPALEDAKFGIGMYRYYADVAPAALRLLRFLLLLPGGNRSEGLQQMIDARDRGQVLRGEADYQLHLVYLWYEKRPGDALAIVRSLQRRYPRNPLFYLLEADVLHTYFNDRAGAGETIAALLTRAQTRAVNLPDVAARRANAWVSARRAPRP